MATIRDDFDGEPLARFLALYSPAGRVPVDVELARSRNHLERPRILSQRADKEETVYGNTH